MDQFLLCLYFEVNAQKTRVTWSNKEYTYKTKAKSCPDIWYYVNDNILFDIFNVFEKLTGE